MTDFYSWPHSDVHYLDYMASTPIDPRVAAKMAEFNQKFPGNPSANGHVFGFKARLKINEASQQLAQFVNASPEEIIWTSGATEASNLAIIGAMQAYQNQGNHMITLATEHEATLRAAKSLENIGKKVTVLPVKADGLVDCQQLEAAITPQTVLISLCHVNNEIGVVQPLQDIANIAQKYGCLFHVDGAQSLGKATVNFQDWGIDYLSLSAHKCYGPQGIGALVVRQQPKRQLQPLLHGGEQQYARSGTLPGALIVGMGTAVQLLQQQASVDFAKIQRWQQQFQHTFAQLGGITYHGSMTRRVPHNLNIHVAELDGDSLRFALNKVAISARSACNSANPEPSHVIKALGYSRQHAQQALRISFGRFCTDEVIDECCQHFKATIEDLRSLAPNSC